MSAAIQLMVRSDAYRDDGGELACTGAMHLSAAADALNFALLTLSGELDEDSGDKIGRAGQARALLVEAVTALSRARIYNPKIRTLALPTLLATERRIDSELSRLHQIATRLLWQNHAYLPAKLQAQPLAPHEEAALRDVFAGLARHARIGRVLRHRSIIAVLTLLCAAPLIAMPLAYVVAFATLTVFVTAGMWRRGRPAPLRAINPGCEQARRRLSPS